MMPPHRFKDRPGIAAQRACRSTAASLPHSQALSSWVGTVPYGDHSSVLTSAGLALPFPSCDSGQLFLLSSNNTVTIIGLQ